MYRCRKCGQYGDEPSRIYEPDCLSTAVCGNCGSEDIAVMRETCAVCGKELYDGDTAYEIRDVLVCPLCVTKVTV